VASELWLGWVDRPRFLVFGLWAEVLVIGLVVAVECCWLLPGFLPQPSLLPREKGLGVAVVPDCHQDDNFLLNIQSLCGVQFGEGLNI
jgi:hypothetical protein